MLRATIREGTKITSIIKNENNLVLQTATGNIKLEPYSDKVIRIVYTSKDEFSDVKSLGIINKSIVAWDFEDKGEFLIFKTSLVKIKISKDTCSFTYLDINDNLLVKEPKDGGKYLEKFDIYKTKDAKVEHIQTVDGEKQVIHDGTKIFDKTSYHTKLEFEWADDEALYGLGQHEEGIMNLRGTCQYIYQANLKNCMPFILSTKGYGILVDTYSASTFHDDQYGSYIWTYADDEMDFYFIYGPTFDEIINEYRQMTGVAPMLPKWAFGYMQSQERYETQEEILDVVKEYRKRKVPLDTIILDWQYWESGLWGEKRFDLSRFPNVKGMTDELHDLGVNFMVSIWPNMKEESSNYKEMQQHDCLLKIGTYNPFKKEARELYWKQASTELFSKGVDGWWCDSSEAFTPEWTGSVNHEPEKKLNMFIEQASKNVDAEYINAFPLLHSQTIYDGQRSETSNKRVVNLTRASYIGQQRNSTILWSGDISAKWDTLRKQIVAGLNFCITGIPYWTLDIGAFFVKRGTQWFWNGDYNDGTDDLGYRELVVRWYQYGAFLPIFRAHGTDARREIWNFGDEGNMFYDSILKFINLRYSLMPYIYSLAGRVTLENYTIMRALTFDFVNDNNVYNIKNQYMFGDSLMICPITEPMYYDVNSTPINSEKTHTVYLPDGTQWYDFWNNNKYTGGETITVNAEIDTMPIFVKAGSIVPIGPQVQYTTEQTKEPLKIYVYTGHDAKFTLYEDSNDSYDYENGEFATIEFDWNDLNKTLTIHDRKGSYKNMVENKLFDVYVIENSNQAFARSVEYVGKSITMTL